MRAREPTSPVPKEEENQRDTAKKKGKEPQMPDFQKEIQN